MSSHMKLLGVMAFALIEGVALAQGGASQTTPKDDTLALVESRCTTCHEAGQALGTKKTAADWSATIDRMVDYGAEFQDGERERILAYLTEHNAL